MGGPGAQTENEGRGRNAKRGPRCDVLVRPENRRRLMYGPLRCAGQTCHWRLPNSDMIGWSRVLLSRTLDVARSY